MDATIEREFDRTTALILAAEEWSDEYRQDPETFGQLLKGEAAMMRHFLVYQKDLAGRAPGFIDWGAYLQKLDQIHNTTVQAAADEFQVDVMISDEQLGHEDDIVL